MQAILSVTFPFFALVLCGWLAARQRWLPISAVPGLNAFVLFFALPCLLFRFGERTPLADLLQPGVLGTYLGAALLLVFVAIAFTVSPRMSLKNAAFGALVAAFPNTGFMGVPLLIGLLGAAASGPMICVLLADMVVTSSVCLAVASLHGASTRGPRASLGEALRNVLANPLPWAIGLGAACGALGLTPLPPVAAVIHLLADAATPVALFTVGAMLWRAASARGNRHSALFVLTSFPPTEPLALMDMAGGSSGLSVWPHSDLGGVAPTAPQTVIVAAGGPRSRPGRSDTTTVLTLALLKLLLHPLLVLLLGAAARSSGAPLTSFQLTVLTLAAALPSASNVSLLAERHGADSGLVARVVLVTTVLAFFSFTLMAWVLRIQPAH